MTWRDEGYLLDILNAAKRARGFVADVDWEKFRTSELHQSAVMRQISIIGEAARRISDQTKVAHPEIPWNDIIGMRHRLVHDYSRINVRLVWETVQDDLPRLIEVVEPLAPRDKP